MRAAGVSAEPLVIELAVAVAPAEAFETWTRRCTTWWPRSHWGSVIAWEPPERLRYRWHLFAALSPG
jgi:hypothetical protein